VNKETRKTSATAQTIAEWCDIPRAQTVSDVQKILASKGYLVDTTERIGANGQSIVWAPGWARGWQRADNTLTTHWQHTGNGLATPTVATVIGKAGSEPLTMNREPSDKRMGQQDPSLLSNKEGKKITRPSHWPGNVDEVYEYFESLYDDPEQSELAEELKWRDASWFFHANKANGWKNAGNDWKAYAIATFDAEHFPSQKEKKKGQHDDR